MKILILAAGYPDNNGYMGQAYIRTRNLFYKENGIEVEVLSFRSKEDYVIDGIKVYSFQGYQRKLQQVSYDALVCHAANLRQHYLFLRKYGARFHRILFFFHGHEVVKINKVYSKPYPYIKRNILLEKLRDAYDEFKFVVWRRYFEKNYQHLHFIFVSQWMKDEFLRWVKLDQFFLEGRSDITYNCVGKVFEDEDYDWGAEKKYDFITIRANIDGSKYAVDIVNNLARLYPDRRFLLVGKGNYFSHYQKADNLEWIERVLNHQEMIDLMNASKCALMPTRTDAQGVMMCEMATFGMPLITSDIPVCHEVFDGFKNVSFMNNDHYDCCTLAEAMLMMKQKYAKPTKYFLEKTCMHEIEIIKHFVKNTPPAQTDR